MRERIEEGCLSLRVLSKIDLARSYSQISLPVEGCGEPARSGVGEGGCILPQNPRLTSIRLELEPFFFVWARSELRDDVDCSVHGNLLGSIMAQVAG